VTARIAPSKIGRVRSRLVMACQGGSARCDDAFVMMEAGGLLEYDYGPTGEIAVLPA
jgi:hypothetical protein